MNTSTTSEPLAQSVQGGIRLVLNGGKNTLDQPTMQIQWFFSSKILEKRPTKVLIIEQNEDEDFSPCAGARYMFNVSDRIAFIQLQSPGKHRIVVLALAGEGNDSVDYMKRRRYRNYKDDVNLHDLATTIRINDFEGYAGEDVISGTFQEIDIPAELFAPKSESTLSKAVWAWTNRWHQSPPRDQCAYRARMIWAFTAQPILFVIGQIFKFLGQIVFSVFIPLIRILAWFIGFRPNPIFSDIKEVWTEFSDWNGDITRYGQEGYRVWERDDEGKPTKLIPITGLEIVIFFGVIWFLASCAISLLVLGCTVLLVGTSIILSDRIAKASGKRGQVLSSQNDAYAIWLKNLALEHAPDQVDLKHLPPVYRGSFVQRFRVSFWDAKIKVCRPFAE